MAEFGYKSEILDNYLNKFTSRIVAESGIPSDKYHLGKIILQSIKDDPDFVMQIDGGTGESETNGSVLRRSVQCATSFRNMGLKTGDVIVLMAPNHLDQAIPFYAALYLGIAVAAIDRTFGVGELKDTFNIDKPKIVFCQSEKVNEVQKALKLSRLDAEVISFDKSTDTMNFKEMLEKYSDNIDVQKFKAAEFDPEDTLAMLISTSGTTGLPKAASITHKCFIVSGSYICNFANKMPSPTRSSLIVAPMQWLSALLNYIFSPYFRFTRIQSSLPFTADHILDLVEKYEPTFLIISPTMMTTLVKAATQAKRGFSSLEVIYVGGSAVHKELLEDLTVLAPNATVKEAYGMSETGSMVFHNLDCPIGSCGKPLAHMQYKLTNTDTGDEITEPNKCGELWVKPPGGFKGYYNNPEATAEAMEDNWFRTGDTMYRDEDCNFYFVERIKLMLKYRSHHISPVELETVIRQHPGVLDVVVTSIPDPEFGDLPVACVIPRSGAQPSEDEIKNLVKEQLSDSKQLRGGVIFMEELPLTSSTKVHRRKLKEMVLAHMSGQGTI